MISMRCDATVCLAVLLSLVAGGVRAPAAPSSGYMSESRRCFDCDGRHFVGLTQSKKLVVWDALTGRAIRTLDGFQDPIYLAMLLPDGRSVLGQSFKLGTDSTTWGTTEKGRPDRSMRLWNIDSGKVAWRIPDSLFDAFSADGRRVYGVTIKAPRLERPKLVCWDLRTGAPAFTMPNFVPNGFLSNIAEESADGQRLLYSDQSGVTVFDLKSREKLANIRSTHEFGAPPAALLGNGDTFFYDSSPGEQGVIALYSLSQNGIVDKATFPSERLTLVGGQTFLDPWRPFAIGWLPRSEGFVSFCTGGHWMSYIKGRGLVDRGKGGTSGPHDIIVSPDEQSFVACYSTRQGEKETFKIEAYDAETCKKRWERPGMGIKFLPNGQLVVLDGDAVVFVDMASGAAKRTIRLEGFLSKND